MEKNKQGCLALACLLTLFIFTLASCQTPAPHTAYYQERVTQLIQESRELKRYGELVPPSAEERKEVVEETLDLVLSQAETEARFIGEEGYPTSLKNAQCYLSMAAEIIHAPREITNQKIHNPCPNIAGMNKTVEQIFSKGDPSEILLGVVFSPVLGLSYIISGLGDALGGWRKDHEGVESFSLNPLLIDRYQVLQNRIQDWQGKGVQAFRPPELNVTMTYFLEGSELDLMSWRNLGFRGELPGNKVDEGVFSDELIIGYYQTVWENFVDQLGQELKRRKGFFLGTKSEINILNVEERKMMVVARLGVRVPNKLANFRNYIQQQSKQYEDVVFDVELHPSELHKESELMEKGLSETFQPVSPR